MTEKIVGPIKISIGVRAAESHFLDPFKVQIGGECRRSLLNYFSFAKNRPAPHLSGPRTRFWMARCLCVLCRPCCQVVGREVDSLYTPFKKSRLSCETPARRRTSIPLRRPSDWLSLACVTTLQLELSVTHTGTDALAVVL